VIALPSLALAAQSGDTSAASSGASNGATSDTLQEVVVTATRREESIEKVPISVEALTQDELTEGGIKDIADIAAVTPGLQFAAPTGFISTLTTISIRGLNTNTGAGVVGIYLDDTPIQSRLSSVTNVGSPFPVVFDLNRVEVERGPQGTLFGAGSEAGTVRFISNSPSLTDFSGFSHAELAMTQDGGPSYEVGAAAGGPIVDDKMGFRISVWDREDGGYVNLIDPITGRTVESNVNSDNKLATRVALAFKVNEDILITPSVFYQSVHVGDSGRFYANFSNPTTGYFVNGRLAPEVSTDDFALPSVKVETHLPFAELTSTTSYLYRRIDVNFDDSAFIGASGLVDYGSSLGPAFPTSPSDIAPQFDSQYLRGFTQEVRLASNQRDALVTWVAGVFYDHRNQTDFQTTSSLPVDPTGKEIYQVSQVVTDDQIAAFGQGDIHFTDKWKATLGARVARVKSALTLYNGTGVLDSTPLVQYAPTVTGTPFTPMGAVSYQADQNNLLYISASKGFRVGGNNIPVPTYCNTVVPDGFKSDYVWSYELGAKDRLFDGRVQIDSSVFHIDWSNIQELVNLQCGYQYTTNTGGAVSNGFELALQAKVTDRLLANIDVGYANAYFTSNVYDGAGAPLVLSGDKIGLLPQVNAPWNVNTSANYEIPLSNGAKVHLRGEYRYTSRNPGPFITQIPTSPNYYPLIVADPPTHLFNGRAGVKMGKLDVTLFVDNVFNSHPLLGMYQDTPTSNLINYSTFRPRTVGLSGNVAF
jgi:iron complex outermembrane recepter protein